MLFRSIARGILDALRLGDVADLPAGDLPFGRQRMMEVCRALALEPALLLLDEPMAGLSGAEREVLAELLRTLRDAGLTVLLVEHDVAQVMALADQVAVLDDGDLIAIGTPQEVQANPKVIAAYLGTEEDEAEQVLEHVSAGETTAAIRTASAEGLQDGITDAATPQAPAQDTREGDDA